MARLARAKLLNLSFSTAAAETPRAEFEAHEQTASHDGIRECGRRRETVLGHAQHEPEFRGHCSFTPFHATS